MKIYIYITSTIIIKKKYLYGLFDVAIINLMSAY